MFNRGKRGAAVPASAVKIEGDDRPSAGLRRFPRREGALRDIPAVFKVAGIRAMPASPGPQPRVGQGEAATTYIDTGLTAGATWHYTVTAHGLPGSGPATTPVSATTFTAQESWRFSHFGSSANTGDAADDADPDGDGWTNASEFAAGTNPNDRTSLLKISSLATGTQDVVIGFPTVAGKNYRVEKSASLSGGSWQTVADPVAGTGAMVEITDPGARLQPRWFYRIAVLP